MSIKLKKTASGGQAVSLTKTDWISIGQQQGWVTQAQGSPQELNINWRCKVCGFSGPKDSFLEEGTVECPACNQPYVEQYSM